MQSKLKHKLRQLRRWRIRKKISGTADRPRMAVKITNQHILVQFIDDSVGHTLAAVSTLRQEGKLGANVAGATAIGKVAAEAAQTKGITAVVFDRAGARYHGKIKALADSARATGLKF